uniref:Uncharacterized protein n=1 Tax=Magnusiomyces tetraspermus TaxID=1232584 RepID=A0A023UMC1_9ASCO|nr:hypothetical protein [Magnusiomyces tetraspermus]AHY04944.1 hypothetical protein [Magnusiomyces tetraspermus]
MYANPPCGGGMGGALAMFPGRPHPLPIPRQSTYTPRFPATAETKCHESRCSGSSSSPYTRAKTSRRTKKENTSFGHYSSNIETWDGSRPRCSFWAVHTSRHPWDSRTSYFPPCGGG